MDDFGTGYSSLSYLRRFPIDKIKIDRSFMKDADTSADALAIIRAVAGLGVSLGMTTLVEGIETEQQLALARAEGVSQGQGYLFGRPQPASDHPRRSSWSAGETGADQPAGRHQASGEPETNRLSREHGGRVSSPAQAMQPSGRINCEGPVATATQRIRGVMRATSLAACPSDDASSRTPAPSCIRA